MKQAARAMLLLVSLSACGTSPEPSYYSLATIPGTASPTISPTIKIHRPTLATYLDRPEFIEQKNDFQITIDDINYWAEPIDRMFERIMADDLRQRLPASHVLTDNEALSENPRFIVNLTIDHFNQTGNGMVLFEGELMVQDNNAAGRVEHIPLHVTADSDSSPQSIALNLSKLVAQTADRLVVAVTHQ